ncbi:uncharacterized protein LOC105834401 [Monomorium pharaonis]|uniref:uncharacterized protein LOC105834401 n=1 Tax=Monomorium pharaonis TaxID=307658 RepID=UPI00063F2879|nr:uncharacterized protein LOC105834401 [Monomorium pharaonis]
MCSLIPKLQPTFRSKIPPKNQIAALLTAIAVVVNHICSYFLMKGHNKRRLSDSSEKSLDRLSEALGEPITVNLSPFIPPVPPPLDKSALFGNLLATQLQDVDPNFLDDTTLQIMQLVNTVKRRK